VTAVLDSNILIDHLRGVSEAHAEIERFEKPKISVVTWIELLVGAAGDDDHQRIRSYLRRFELIELNEAVRNEAVRLRRERRLRLPDAVIWASARVGGYLLVTRNTRDFPTDDLTIRVPYRI